MDVTTDQARVLPRGGVNIGRCLALLSLLLTSLTALAAVSVLSASSASADTCPPGQGTFDPSTGQVICTIPGGGGDDGSGGGSGGGGGGSSTPSCQLYADYTYCLGNQPCKAVEWHPPMALPAGPKPSPDSVPMARYCGFPDPATQGPIATTIYWSGSGEPEPPTLAEQARTAIGQLDLDLPQVVTNPPDRTLVNFSTWFWVDGARPVAISSSAFGLRVIATASDLRIDPGDGSGGFTCPWTASAEAAEGSCTYEYTRDSDNGSTSVDGRPAYEVSASSTWNLRFVLGGNEVEIPGAPASLPGPTSTAALRVDQVQSLVSDTD